MNVSSFISVFIGEFLHFPVFVILNIFVSKYTLVHMNGYIYKRDLEVEFWNSEVKALTFWCYLLALLRS
jgi:hypothetical protein